MSRAFAFFFSRSEQYLKACRIDGLIDAKKLMRKYLFPLLAIFPSSLCAAPACVMPEAKSVVIASSSSDLADGHSARWLLESVDGARRVLLERCSERSDTNCYFAVDIEPGRYYFKEVIPGAYNHMQYPVSKPDFWFEISGKGVDYIGNWIIARSDQRSKVKLQVGFDLKSLDSMRALCRLEDRKLYIGRIKQPSIEMVD